jgi:uncharacterized protein YneF (UPF0154 family)|tara:strand:- start:48 stop:239 length:192 start_codon:yes stop_codon:yes gene_type:complete
MDFEHGLAMFFIGCTLTVIGFLIAFMIASRVVHKENKKNRPLSSVEQSLKELRSLNGKYSDTE